LIGSDSYLAKIDLRNAYRSIPIHPSDYNLTGIAWKFAGDMETTHLVDTKLPFGSAKSCHFFQRISDSVSKMMARRGMNVLIYLDDMLCIGEDELSCKYE
jgi:hypothetical protein